MEWLEAAADIQLQVQASWSYPEHHNETDITSSMLEQHCTPEMMESLGSQKSHASLKLNPAGIEL